MYGDIKTTAQQIFSLTNPKLKKRHYRQTDGQWKLKISDAINKELQLVC